MRILHISSAKTYGGRERPFVDENRIDILHAHESKDYLAANIAHRITGYAKVVVTRQLLSPLKPFNRFALRNISAAIAVSPEAKLQLNKIFPEEKVFVIPNG